MPPEVLVLAFDTSAAHCAAALLRGDRIVALKHERMHRGQAERLMPMLEEMLAAKGVGWRDLTRIGVGIGPGNFTGVRISVAAARGLALSLGCPAIGISALEASAFGVARPVLAAMDARRGEVYLQRFDAEGAGEPVLASPDALPVWAFGVARIVGDAAPRLAPLLPGAAALAAAAPLAEAIARLASARPQAPPPQRPAPLYLRPADAAPPRDPAPELLP